MHYDRQGYWVVDWSTARVPAVLPRHSPTVADFEAIAADVFLQEYTPQPGDTIVDIGAGVGWELSLWSRLVGNAGRVIAVEADPINFRWLDLRRQLNSLSNVTVVQAAVADCPGEVYISGDRGQEITQVATEGQGIAVRALTIDDLVVDYDLAQLDFLKVNIEGAERLAIRGMSNASSLIRHATISCHDFLADRGGAETMRTKETVRTFLTSHGFTVVERRTSDQRDWAQGYLYAHC